MLGHHLKPFGNPGGQVLVGRPPPLLHWSGLENGMPSTQRRSVDAAALIRCSALFVGLLACSPGPRRLGARHAKRQRGRSSRARHVLFGAWRAAHEAGSEDHGWAGRGGCVFVVSCQRKARARHSAPRSGALRSPRAGDSRGARPRAAATRRAARHTRRGSGAEGVGAGVSPAGARAPPAPSLGTLGAAGVLRARG
jgi:hypothetical protein